MDDGAVDDGAVIVRNLTRGTWLATEAAEAGGFWARGWGLLGRSGLGAGEGLVIAPCRSIHSWFMRFPFDAVFFDREYRVRHLIQAMPAWRFSRYVRRAYGVLELPAGVIAASRTQVGDQLEISRESRVASHQSRVTSRR